MDWYDKFKQLFGFPSRQESPTINEQDRTSRPPCRDDGFHEPPFPNTPPSSFSIFADPLEIHKYFEQQMGEMLRNFGFHEFGSFGFPELGAGESFVSQIEEIPSQQEVESGDLQDQFLKPGYEKPSEQKRDRDVDGKLDITNWESVFRGDPVTPYEPQVAPRTHFFGQSVTSKTVRNADGSLETHRTVRDSQGNEETTITRKIGDKEYTVTKRRDKAGNEEVIENMVNLQENDLDKFLTKSETDPPESQRWPFFDRFFK